MTIEESKKLIEESARRYAENVDEAVFEILKRTEI